MKRRETTHAERVEIIQRHKEGETLESIAKSLDLNKYTVRHWWREYRDSGFKALEPKPQGPPAVGPLGRFDPLVKYVALRLKLEHSSWGSPMLLLHMKRKTSLEGLALPKSTALWNYLHQFGSRLFKLRRLPTKRPISPPIRAEAPHQCWEMDFKGDEVVQGCQVVISPLALSDEASGAPLDRFIHTLKAKGNRKGLNIRKVQADLRRSFTKWGLPNAIRMDRDPIFIGSSRLEWPSVLLLWLVGLGIQPIINRPFRPTDNAMVERSHRTFKSDVLLGCHFVDLVALQTFSDQALQDRLLNLPSKHRGCNGKPPVTAFPNLMKVNRYYHPDQEKNLFDLRRVDAYLTQWEWQRKVDSSGKISLADRNHNVSKLYKDQVVKVRFDPNTRQFVCSSVDGEEINRLNLFEVSQDFIIGEGV